MLAKNNMVQSTGRTPHPPGKKEFMKSVAQSIFYLNKVLEK